MTTHLPTRRHFLRWTGTAGALAVLHPSWATPAPTSGDKVLVRRDVMSLAPDGPEIEAFRRGIAEMKKRDPGDPTSWIYQANIHLTRDTPVKRGWNQCQHGNYFFLPWHRLYTYWLERILRKASGDPNFTVPYWNYASPTARALPLALRAKDWAGHPGGNPLYVAERNPDAGGLNNGALLPASAVVTYWNAFRLTQFATPSPTAACFGGLSKEHPGHHALSTMSAFESHHNLLHVLLGGKGGYMSDLPMSARDPLFLLHHANVDRLWKRWLDQGGRANPTNDPHWMDAKFLFFDEDGKEVEMSVKDALDTEDQLGYRYDDDPPAVVHPKAGPLPEVKPLPLPPPRVAESKSDKAVDLGTSGPVTVTLDLPEQARKALADDKATLTLLLEGLQFVPADEEPTVYYEVYLNLPAGKGPDFQDVHYAGNLVFAGLGLFGKQHPHLHPGTEKKDREGKYLDGLRAFDVTETVRDLRARKLLPPDRLTVTFVMGGLVPVKPGTPVTTPGVKARFDRVALARS